MKKVLFRFSFNLLLFIFATQLQAQGFIWVKGAVSTNSAGAYGNVGTINIGNNPGSRHSATHWKDASGNFWMFGGNGYDLLGNQGLLNDLWKYDPTTNTWIWISGANVFSQVGVYGLMGVPSNTVKPGSRHSAKSWLDASGNIYIYGGYGYDAFATIGYLNDLWKFNTSTNQWTWMKGNNFANQVATYGSLGTANSANLPGARTAGATWTDNTGNIWLFGGYGITTNSTTNGYLNDLWKYDIAANQFTWISGGAVTNQTGTYGTQGVASASNVPGSRTGSSTWIDGSGNLLLFGGSGYDASTSSVTALNDLWKFDLSNNQWTWLKGSNTGNQNGVYGSMAVASVSNTPGSRSGAVSWKDTYGNYWLSAGDGYSAVNPGLLNDMWLYNASSNNWTWVAGAGNSNLPGVYGTLNTPGVSNIFGARRNSSSWIDGNNNLWFFGGFGQAQTGTQGYLNDTWRYTNCVINPISLTITSNNPLPCTKETLSLTVTGSNTYTWNTGFVGSYLVISPTITTTYSAYTNNTNSCIYSSAFTQSVSNCNSINQFFLNQDEQAIYPNPSNGQIHFKISTYCDLVICNLAGEIVFEQALYPTNEGLKLNLNSGLYFYRLLQNKVQINQGKLIIDKN